MKPNKQTTTKKPYTMLGAGQLVSTIWKDGDEQSGWSYRFNVYRMSTTMATFRNSYGRPTCSISSSSRRSWPRSLQKTAVFQPTSGVRWTNSQPSLTPSPERGSDPCHGNQSTKSGTA